MTDEQPTSRRAARGAGDPAEGETQPKATGIGALFAKHRTGWLIGAGAVVFVLLGTGALFAGVSVGSAAEAEPEPTPTAEALRDLPDGELTPSRLRTCSVAPLAADPALMSLSGQVVRIDTGEVLFDRAGDTPARTASVMKLLTAAAALATLGPDFQITTSVVQGSTPGSIVLIGRGDPTLSATSPGSESVYRGAPKLADLAAATLAAYNGPQITNIVLDSSYWSTGDKWDPSWKRTEQTRGYHSEVTALQVDGDRADPSKQDSPRSTDPVGRAGAAFLAALRAADSDDEVADNVTFTVGSAVTTVTLAEVKSQPLRVLIPYMLLVSDNTLAEMLARITSIGAASNGSAVSLQQVIPSALSEYDIPPTGMVIRDGSGLSDLNAVPPSTVVKLLIAMTQGGPHLDVVYAGLPIAGQTGTLSGRFTGPNSGARGHVWAKTGWIDTAYTLAGIVQAADGTMFAFAFYAIGDGIQSTARAALDTLTTGVYNCGDNLSNN